VQVEICMVGEINSSLAVPVEECFSSVKWLVKNNSHFVHRSTEPFGTKQGSIK